MKKIFIIAGLIFGLLILLGAAYDYLLEMGEKTPKSTECKKCHATIYEEWTKNFHAKAYVNDQFKQATNAYGKQECLACHAAQQIAAEKSLIIRPVSKEEGVNCATCHLRNNMIYGTYKLVAKHKAEQDESMRKSAFCSGCHMSTYQEWQAGDMQKQCQDCHMPRVERKLVQGFPLSSVVPKRMAGQHLQMYEGIFQGAATITGQKGTGAVTISLTNTGAGHTMPTGKYGDYRVVLKTTVLNAEGKEVLSQEEIFSTQQGNGVPFKKTVRYEYPLPAGTGKGYKVKATLVYQRAASPDITVASWSAE